MAIKPKSDIDRYQLTEDDKLFALGYKTAMADLLNSLEDIKLDIMLEEQHETFAKMKEEIIDDVLARVSESAGDNYYYTLEALEQDHLDEDYEEEEDLKDKDEIPF